MENGCGKMAVGILWLMIPKERECFFLSEGSTHAELVAMAEEILTWI